MRRFDVRVCVSCSVSLLAACATVDPRADFDAARAQIRDATGVESVFDPDLPLATADDVRAVLEGGLTLDEALALALTNNRRLQAGFSELGVGRADFVQAGLLENPTLSLAFLFPAGGGRTRVGVDLMQSVSDIWQMPERKELARAGQEERLLELSRFAGVLVADTRAAYFESVAARAARDVGEANVQLANRVLAGVRRQVEVGVATKPDELLAQGHALAAELAYRRTERDEARGKQRLGALLSLADDLARVELIDPLPAAPLPSADVDVLIAISQRLRLDVQAARRTVATADARVAYERSRAVPETSAGVTTERPESGSETNFLGGVAGSIELPIFDTHRVQVRRAEYQRDAATKELEALLADAAQAVRAAADRLHTARASAEFVERELLPQAERGAALAQRAHELGDVTVLALLSSQSLVLAAREHLIDARTESLRASSELERALGAPLPVALRSSAAAAATARP